MKKHYLFAILVSIFSTANADFNDDMLNPSSPNNPSFYDENNPASPNYYMNDMMNPRNPVGFTNPLSPNNPNGINNPNSPTNPNNINNQMMNNFNNIGGTSINGF